MDSVKPVVDQNIHYYPMLSAPTGKCLGLTRAGVTVIGRPGQDWVGWFPLPNVPPEIKKLIIGNR